MLTSKIHTDSKKRRCALLFASGDFGRSSCRKTPFEVFFLEKLQK